MVFMILTLSDKIAFRYPAERLALGCHRCDASALTELGLRFLEGNMVEPSDTIGKGLLRRAAQMGSRDANALLHVLDVSVYVPKWNTTGAKRIITALQNAATCDSVWAMTELGFRYRDGIGVKQDTASAIEWFTKGAIAGSAIAAYEMGVLSEPDDGRCGSCDDAIKWYRCAADRGDSDAQFNLALILREQGGHKDIAVVVKLLDGAAKAGNGRAIYELGLCYDKGSGVVRSPEKASVLYKRAAKKGVAQAQVNYGVLIHNSASGNADYRRALRWYTWAALQGAVLGCKYLAQYLRKGISGLKDEAEARFWESNGASFIAELSAAVEL